MKGKFKVLQCPFKERALKGEQKREKGVGSKILKGGIQKTDSGNTTCFYL